MILDSNEHCFIFFYVQKMENCHYYLVPKGTKVYSFSRDHQSFQNQYNCLYRKFHLATAISHHSEKLVFCDLPQALQVSLVNLY